MANEINRNVDPTRNVEYRIGTDLKKLQEEMGKSNGSMPASIFNFINDDRDGIITNNVELQLFTKLMNEAKDVEMPTIEPDAEGAVVTNGENEDGVYTQVELDNAVYRTYFAEGTPRAAIYGEKNDETEGGDHFIDNNHDGIADSRTTTGYVNGNRVIQRDNDLDGRYDQKTVITDDAELNYIRNEKGKWILKERIEINRNNTEDCE